MDTDLLSGTVAACDNVAGLIVAVAEALRRLDGLYGE
jgi:hypothetical protein